MIPTNLKSVTAVRCFGDTERITLIVMDILKTTDIISDTAETATDTTTATKPRPVVDLKPSTGDGDHDRFAHYIRKSHSMQAYIEGISVRALCGKVWVPSRDPSRYPVCPTCAKIREGLPSKSSN